MAIISFYMFYSCMLNIYSPYSYTKTKVNFKCHSGYTDVKTSENKDITVNNYTTFFRNYPSLKFTKEYLLKKFPQGTKIAEFGCSTGQKPYSLMIMLDRYNKDKKYKMTGYDFAEILNKTKIPLYGLNEYIPEEQILFETYNKSELFDKKYMPVDEAKEFRDTFFKYFEQYEPEKIITGYRYNDLKKLVNSNPNSNSFKIQKAKQDLLYSDLIRQCSIVVKAKEDSKSLVDFKNGDINDIDKILIPEQNGAVIFQNALYHVMGNGIDYEIQDLVKNIDKAQKIFKKINKVLPYNGIFVLGNLSSDHIYDVDNGSESETHLLYQDGERIRVFDSSPIHQALKENGFEPVFYEKVSGGAGHIQYREVHVPAVWKKTRNV